MPIALSWDNVAERKAWSAELLKTVAAHKADLDSGDPEGFIPGYNNLSPEQQVKFWAELVIAIAEKESSWRPDLHYHEPAPLNYDSIGLLQLSYEDADNYPFEPLDPAKKSLEDPLVNLRCGIVIMSKLLKKDHVVASGGASNPRGATRYWSVLRKGKKLDAIKARTRQQLGL